MSLFVVTEQAMADLRGIGRYTATHWSLKQSEKYLRKLAARFEWLAKNPHYGTHRNEIREGYMSFPEGEHLIFYRIKPGKIEILGVLHKRMDFSAHLE